MCVCVCVWKVGEGLSVEVTVNTHEALGRSEETGVEWVAFGRVELLCVADRDHTGVLGVRRAWSHDVCVRACESWQNGVHV